MAAAWSVGDGAEALRVSTARRFSNCSMRSSRMRYCRSSMVLTTCVPPVLCWLLFVCCPKTGKISTEPSNKLKQHFEEMLTLFSLGLPWIPWPCDSGQIRFEDIARRLRADCSDDSLETPTENLYCIDAKFLLACPGLPCITVASRVSPALRVLLRHPREIQFFH